ncbi:MAG: single-stranded DNA-binding protein [Byssovorax sp.]
MSDGINKVMLLGRLGQTPELRVTQAGLSVLHMRVATNDSYLDRDKVRRERTEWHTVVLFGRRAEALAKILAKGMPVFVEGSLRGSSYERDGQTFHKTEIVAKELLLVGSAGKGSEGEVADDHGEDERPAARPAPRPKSGRGRGKASPTLPGMQEEQALREGAYGESAYAEGGERDIPF